MQGCEWWMSNVDSEDEWIQVLLEAQFNVKKIENEFALKE